MSTIQMHRATILALKRDVDRVTHALITSRLFQPRGTPMPLANGQGEGPGSAPGAVQGVVIRQPELLNAYRKLEQDLLVVLERFGVSPPEEGDGEADPGGDLAPIRRALDEVDARLADYDRERGQLEEQLRLRERAEVTREALAAKGLSAARLSGAERVLVRLGWVPREAMGHLRDALEKLTSALEPLVTLDSHSLLLALALPRDRDHVDGALLGAGFQAQALREEAVRRVPDTRLGELRAARDRLAARYAAIRREWATRLVEFLQRVRIDLVVLENQTFGLATGPAVVFQGWVPEPDAEALREQLRRATSGQFVMTLQPAEAVSIEGWETEPVPILHRNPLLLQPFQRLVAAYGEPVYAEVDPTPVFAVSFILMFGFMFGDVGQGALVAAVGYGLYRRMPGRQDVGILLMECGIASILFGVLFGNIFGIEHRVLPHLWFRPMDNIPLFLNVAVVFGAVFLSIGFVFNLINALHRRAYLEAVLGKHGLAAAFLYWILAGVIIRYFLAANKGVAVSQWVVGLVLGLLVVLLLHRPVSRWVNGRRPIVPRPVLPFLLESAIEVVDTVSQYVGHTVSFLRLAAFALMHVGLFIAIFTVGDMLARLTGGSAGYWLMVILGNLVVVVVEGCIVAIQVLRLEYYEFFSKFYQGGGRAFRPMGSRPGGSRVT